MTDHFRYENKDMFCENVRVADVAKDVGTPAYIYSKASLVHSFREFDSAFSGIDHLVCYSMKANSNLNVCRIFYDAGSGIDCNSGGEFYRALKAGVDPHRIVFTGVGKTAEEIRMVLQHPVIMLKVESLQELHLVNAIAGELKIKAPIGIRVNPDVDPKTHPYISTGLSENKFGIESSQAVQAFELASSMPNLRPVGIDMHIGSQITEAGPFVEACKKLAEAAALVKSRGITLSHFDVGGGLGISYDRSASTSPSQLAKDLLPILRSTGCKILFEPGRFLTAKAGILAAKVLYTKQNRKKNFIVVDAAMNDLLRPSLYKAFHEIKPVRQKSDETIIADIVGPICESGDFFAHKREIQKSEQGDLLAVMSAGAYSFAMSSNYNQRRRAPEVIVDANKYYVVRERETYEDLIAKERLIDELIA
ncbi:MAG: diaminopimelate decarboxylase [Bacteroidota bacterium]